MFKFNGASLKHIREECKLTVNDMMGEFFVRGHKVCLKTLYRWEDPKIMAQPKSEDLMVITDIISERDPCHKIVDLFICFNKNNYVP